MTTYTDKEQLKKSRTNRQPDVRDNVERLAYEIALASLEAEPVAWLHSDNGLGIPAITRSKNIADSWLSKGWYVQPLIWLSQCRWCRMLFRLYRHASFMVPNL
ncbi:hypothetical protein [Escherichia coli]|uniref:hypothetical protein n=1 Tax=Escherichia coli TaxID=562 RepID=UPI0039A5B088